MHPFMRSVPAVVFAVLFVAAPAWADFRLDRKLALAPGGAFSLRTDAGAVRVVGDSASGVVVSVTSTRNNLDSYMDFAFEAEPGMASVSGVWRKWRVSGWFDQWRSARNLRFDVHVPRDTEVTVYTAGGPIHVSALVGPVYLRTSGGAVQVQDLAGDLEARTSGGPVRVERVAGTVSATTSGGAINVAAVGGHVRASTSGGSITIDATRGDVQARTSGGAIRVRQAGGRVEARTSGGPVAVDFATGNGQGGMITTSGGGVTAAVDPASALSIDASTSGGRVSSDLSLTVRGGFARNELRGDLNGGGSTLRLRTSGGPIRISAATSRGI